MYCRYVYIYKCMYLYVINPSLIQNEPDSPERVRIQNLCEFNCPRRGSGTHIYIYVYVCVYIDIYIYTYVEYSLEF